MPSKPVTAATVREYFRKDAARVARLSDAAAHTVRPGAIGRLHPEAIKAFNSKRRKDARYAPGATTAAKAEAKASAAKVRADLRAAGVAVGKRGPLPKVQASTPKA